MRDAIHQEVREAHGSSDRRQLWEALREAHVEVRRTDKAVKAVGMNHPEMDARMKAYGDAFYRFALLFEKYRRAPWPALPKIGNRSRVSPLSG